MSWAGFRSPKGTLAKLPNFAAKGTGPKRHRQLRHWPHRRWEKKGEDEIDYKEVVSKGKKRWMRRQTKKTGYNK